mgnify:CR=1 FL=1|tara:strand:- start:601 stop:1530 length:930 start_codon:yes stop_codon:yes gene_type:complete
MNKIIITGGLGHIGTSLITKLLKNKNNQVIVIDNLSTSPINNLFQFLEKKYFKRLRFIKIDLSKNFKTNIFKKSTIVIHLSGFTDQEKSFDKSINIIENNYGSTKNIVLVCKKYKIPLIFPSTTSLYTPRKKKNVQLTEKSTELFPKTPYAKCKLKEENYIKKKLKKFLILRLATVVGYSEGMKFHTVVNKFCLYSKLNKKLPVWNTAYNQVRPYLSLEELVDNILFFIKNKSVQINGRTLNLLTENLSIKEIIDKIKKFSPTKKKLIITKSMNKISFALQKNIYGISSNNKFTIEKSIKNLIKMLNFI